MLKPNEKEALQKLMGEDGADEFLEETDSINRSIDNSDMIVRENETTTDEKLETETEEEIQEPTVEDEPTEELPADDETPAETEEEPQTEDHLSDGVEVEMDQDLFDEITETVAKEFRSEIDELKERVATQESLIETLVADTQSQSKNNEKRFALLEADEDEKKKQWRDDLPRKRRMTISRRRSGEQVIVEPEDVSSDDVASETLSNIPSSYNKPS